MRNEGMRNGLGSQKRPEAVSNPRTREPIYHPASTATNATTAGTACT